MGDIPAEIKHKHNGGVVERLVEALKIERVKGVRYFKNTDRSVVFSKENLSAAVRIVTADLT